MSDDLFVGLNLGRGLKLCLCHLWSPDWTPSPASLTPGLAPELLPSLLDPLALYHGTSAPGQSEIVVCVSGSQGWWTAPIMARTSATNLKTQKL